MINDVSELNFEKFLVAGDWHAQGHQAKAAFDLATKIGGVQGIVHVGDFALSSHRSTTEFIAKVNERALELDMWLLFVDGNHENFPHLESFQIEPAGHRFVAERVIHLPRGLRWTWQGINFGALGGAHSVDHQWRVAGKNWWATEYVNDAELELFRSGGPVDVVFMHDSPAGAPNEITDNEELERNALKNFGPYNMRLAADHRRRLATAIDPADPALIFHGHYHRRMESKYLREGGRECRVIGLDQGGAVDRNTYLFDGVQELNLVSRDYAEVASV